MTSSRTAATGDSARRKWSASGRRPRAPRSRVSGSGSATSACSSGRTTLESAMWIVGVDVGGTTTAAGVVTEGGEVVADVTAPTERSDPGRAVDAIAALIEQVSQRMGRRGTAIGIGVPGPVDTRSGRVGEPVTHVPALAGLAVGPELARRCGLPVFVDNDVNALALGEWMFGAARGVASLVVLAAGTGVGGGIVLDGHLVRGAGFGGELGHTPVKFDGPPCFCGGRGCLAIYASGRGIADAARARVAGLPDAPLLTAAGGDPRAITAPLVFRAAREGDAVASAVVDEACRALGAMLGAVVNGLNPELIVLTGGVAESLVPLEAQILQRAAEYAFRAALARTRVTIVPGDKRTSMRGAAALAIYEIARAGGGTP